MWRFLSSIESLGLNSLGSLGGLIPFVILFSGIGFGIYFHRRSDDFGAGFISFKDGTKTGVIISVITGLCVAAFAMFFYTIVNPDYVQEAEAGLRAAMELENKDAAEIEKKVTEMKSSGKLGNLMFGIFTITLVIGIAASSIIAGLLKRDPNSGQDTV